MQARVPERLVCAHSFVEGPEFQESTMAAFLWFLLGLWIGGSGGFMLFAWLQTSRDSAQASDALW